MFKHSVPAIGSKHQKQGLEYMFKRSVRAFIGSKHQKQGLKYMFKRLTIEPAFNFAL